MVILHVAAIENNPCNGVCVIVPQHVIAQSRFAKVGLVNINNSKINLIENQFEYKKPFSLSDLPSPFNNPDIVVFQETYRVDYLPIAKNLQKKGIPYVTIPHGELGKEAQHKKWLKKKVANILLFNQFINHAAAVQCLSQRELDNTYFGKKKIIATNGMLIPNAQKEVFGEDNVKFLYIGRLDAYHKGLDLLIEACRIKAEFMREHNCTLEIYGPDLNGRAAHLEELIREADVADFVKLFGPISGEEKEKKLLEGDVFIQTSRFEGMPLGILEAMSYAIPCLITEGTTLGENVLKANAGWVASTDAESISAKIEEAVLDRAEYMVKGRNGREYVKHNFSWDEVAKETIKAYQQLAK